MEQDQEILETQLEPILKYFDDETVIEIMLKADGSVIVESFKTGMHVVPERIEEPQKEIIARILAHQEEKKILFQNYSMGAKFHGCRVHLITPPVSPDGTVINFRIPPRLNPTLDDYVANGLLVPEQAEYLREIVAARKNIVICGGTGSGKTTLLRALLLLIPDDCERHIYVVEDNQEINLKHIRNKTQIKTIDQIYTYQQAVRDALRMRPDSIIFGELRDGSAYDLLKAWNTGHSGGFCTIHANSATEAIDRLVQLAEESVMNASKQMIVSAIDLIIYMEKSKGKFSVKEIIEPISWDGTSVSVKKIRG